MDALHFDGYTSYSDSSAPRTPSPNNHFPMNFPMKQPVLDIYPDNHDDPAVVVPVEHQSYSWNPSGGQFQFQHSNSSRGSLLRELYDHDIQDQHQQHLTPEFQSAEPQFVQDNWQQQQQHQAPARPHDYQMMRRATFPYVRHDREDMQQIPPFFPPQQQHQTQQHPHHLHSFGASRHDQLYPEQLSEGNALPNEPGFLPNSSPHQGYHELHDPSGIKLEEGATQLLHPHQQQQAQFYRSAQATNGSGAGPSYPLSMSYLSPHTGLPVQHTDDAASKETQYLRRRCFNCHTTEPPSWRRSTLNPGKIVCNKCGLYERTHLRPRPLRFDELRAGNKQRKQNKRTLSPKGRPATANGAGTSPSGPGSPGAVKKEPREFGLVRRSSVSSASSVHSGSGASDWDDNVSVYSSSAGSAPPTSFNSPNVSSYPLSRDESSSPPQTAMSSGSGSGAGIRLPNASLSDIAAGSGATASVTGGVVTQSPQLGPSPTGLPQTPNMQPPSLPHTPNLGFTPRKSHTSPEIYFSSSSANSAGTGGEDYFMRRASESEQQLLASPLPTPVVS